MISQLYTLFFVIGFVLLILSISLFKNRLSVFYVMLYVSVLVSLFGYMQIAHSSTYESAIFANQTVYFGACFSPFFLLMCVAELCKVEIKKVYQAFFIIYSCILLVLTITTEISDLYYKSVHIMEENGVTRLIKEHGPLHKLYPIYLGIIMIVGFALIIRSYKSKKDVSYITSTLLMVVMTFIVMIYAIEKILKTKYDFVSMAYVIGLAGIFFLLWRISLYDISSISADSMAESKIYGFILFDSRFRYLGGDPVAKEWFPELKELPIDVPVKKFDSKLLAQIECWIKDDDDNEIVHYKCGDVSVEATHKILRERKHRVIHCIYLRDDTKQQMYTKLVEEYNENLEKDVNAKTQKIKNIQEDIVISMASIVENRDNNTGGHIVRTSDIVKIFIRHLKENSNISMEQRVGECIIKAAPLHDFGKISIPDIILNKPGKFTPEEYDEMKKHSAKGAVLVAQILMNSDDFQFKEIAVNVAHYHHEKWDGSGYPDGLAGEEIPFEARVMALADVFDALVSKRVYKERFGYDKAFSIIEESCGSHFDPVLCKEFLKCRTELEQLYDSYDD